MSYSHAVNVHLHIKIHVSIQNLIKVARYILTIPINKIFQLCSLS